MEITERPEPEKINKADIEDNLKRMSREVLTLLSVFSFIEFGALSLQSDINRDTTAYQNFFLKLVTQIAQDGKLLADSLLGLNTFYVATLIAAYTAFSTGQLHRKGDLTPVIHTMERIAYGIIAINLVALFSQLIPPIDATKYRVHIIAILCMLPIIIVSALAINLAIAQPDHVTKRILEIKKLELQRYRTEQPQINITFKKLIFYQFASCILATIITTVAINLTNSGREEPYHWLDILWIFLTYQALALYINYIYATLMATHTSPLYQLTVHIGIATLAATFISIWHISSLGSSSREIRILLESLSLLTRLIICSHMLIALWTLTRPKRSNSSTPADHEHKPGLKYNYFISTTTKQLSTTLLYYSSFHIFTFFHIREIDLEIQRTERKLNAVTKRIRITKENKGTTESHQE